MKDMKMKTKTILGFATPIVLTVFNVILGDMAAKGVLTVEHPESYLNNARIFTGIVAVISAIITIVIATFLIKAIDKNVGQFYEAAKVMLI